MSDGAPRGDTQPRTLCTLSKPAERTHTSTAQGKDFYRRRRRRRRHYDYYYSLGRGPANTFFHEEEEAEEQSLLHFFIGLFITFPSALLLPVVVVKMEEVICHLGD